MALNNTVYFDRQSIASKSGIILENLLDHLSDLYEYSLPKRKTLKYTLGELMDALQPKYLKHIKVVHIQKTLNQNNNPLSVETEFQIQPIVEELKKLIFIRNQVGAHFTLEEYTSDKDVELFGRKTLELGKTLICPETGVVPNSKKADHWKSPSGLIKLYPAEKISN